MNLLKRSCAVLLSASLAFLSAGLEPWQAAAAQVAPRSGPAARVLPVTIASPRLSLSPLVSGLPQGGPSLSAAPSLTATPVLAPVPAPALSPVLSAPSAALPLLPAAVLPQAAATPEAAVTPFEKTMSLLQAPSALEGAAPRSSGETTKDGAASDFAAKIGDAAMPQLAATAGGASPANTFPKTGSALQPASRQEALPDASVVPLRKQSRSPAFPGAVAGLLAAVSAAFYGAMAVVPRASEAVSRPGAVASLLGGAAVVAGVAAVAAGVAAVVDVFSFVSAMRRGRGVTDADFWAFVRAEVMAGRVDPGAAELLKIHRPKSGWDLDFGYHGGGSIYLRPELSASPALFRRVLLHELKHYKEGQTRGPPRGRIRSFLSGLASELRARRAELGASKALPKLRIPVLERVLRQAQLSLKSGQPYDVLVLNSQSKELQDPKIYGDLSGGQARVEAVKTAAPQDILGEARNLRRFGAVVLDKPFELLPAAEHPDHRRLQLALKQLDSLFVLATRLVPQAGAGFKTGTADSRKYQELGEQAVRLDRRDRKQVEHFEKLIKQFWREIAATRLKGMAVSSLMENLYKGMRNKGMAFLSFGPADPGLAVWERLLRYWEAEDGGQFRVTRVDLENGGHILILRKIESRVGLWLKPLNGGIITASVPNASASPEGKAAARQALLAAGFEKHLEKFESLDVDVRHVFGSDVGRQEVYVTIPRRNAGAIRNLVAGNSINVSRSQIDFQPHLIGSSDLHAVAPLWKMGITGAGGTILWIDTGADASHEDFQGRLDVVDMVNEGPEDWIGHGTHVAGISISGTAPYTGMAKAGRGIMAKVFSRESPGASDGDIMASGALALQKGVDVINLSLGSRGSSSDSLAIFFSELTKKPNSKGEYVFVTASAGNSGPFDRTLSQPSAGEEVNSTAAAALSPDDSVPEIAFYSSVGPDLDKRFAVKRLRLKPDETVKGGDVTTRPGSADVYEHGTFSAKSKDMARGPSDTEDGKHTGLSGTSMSSPLLAGIALLVKLAIRLTGAETAWAKENLPLVIKAVLMRTAVDMQVPVWYQGAGFAQAYEAVKLIAATVGYSLNGKASRLWSRLGLRSEPASASSDPWAWVARYRAVMSLEDKVYAEAELAKTNAQARFDEGATEDADAPVEDRQAEGDAIQNQVVKKFNAARQEVLPELTAALKDPVWLVRRQAAFTLLNLKIPAAAMPLAEAALKDEDGRVRQMAFLALAEMPTHVVDVLLQQAAADARWDVGLYAAYALARHGDRGGVPRIVSALSHQDKWVRFSAVWLLGQLGSRASAVESQALSSRIKDLSERGNIRHLAAAALSNIAEASPAAIPDAAIFDLYEAAGSQNLALTRTIAKVFPAAFKNKTFVARMNEGALKEATAGFVLKNKAAVSKPGALGELVSLLARVIKLPLDQPTSLPDPNGAGVAGVDAALGALDVLIELKAGLPAPDAAELARFGAKLEAELPLSGALWVSVPEHKLFAFGLQMRNAGHGVRLSTAKYTASRRVGAETAFPGLTIDAGAASPQVPEGADLSLVRVTAAAGVSEARVMAVLEAIGARAADTLKSPVIVVVTMGGPGTAQSPLTRLINQLALENIGVIVPAGNEGPADNTVSSLAKSNLAVVVAAAGRTQGLAGYSARGTADKPTISWTDVVDDLAPDLPSLSQAAAEAARVVLGLPAAPEPAAGQATSLGTGVAAEATAEKLAVLARRMAQALSSEKGSLPDGYFFYLMTLVKQTLTAMPDNQPHEVGAGLFEDAGKARALLESKLSDPEKVREQARALAAEARRRQSPPQGGQPVMGPTLWQRLRRSVKGALAPLLFEGLSGAAEDAARQVLPAQPSAPAAGEGPARLKQLRQVLGDGTLAQGRLIEPFTFSGPAGRYKARGAGLEGFLYSKLEVEGSQPFDGGQLKDYFAYVDALLAPAAWTADIRGAFSRLRDESLTDGEKNARFNALLTSAVAALQEQSRALDASAWGRQSATYMIFSRAYNRLRPGKDFFASLDAKELSRIKKTTHANEIWLMDIFSIGEIHRWGTGGGSSYSIKGYSVKPELGGEEGLKAFIARAHAAGLRVKVDFIPNHASLDSRMVSERPEGFLHLVPPQHLSDAEIMASVPRQPSGEPMYWLISTDHYPEGGKRVKKRILVHHPRTDWGDGMWTDLAQIDYTQPAARDWQISEMKRLFTEVGVDSLRRDMAYDILNARYFQRWVAILERELKVTAKGWAYDETRRLLEGFKARWAALDGAEFLAEATDAVKAVSPGAVMIDEAYAHAVDLSRSGSDGIYNKADFDPEMGQTGLYDAMVSRDADRIRSALRNAAFRRWQRGGSPMVNFVGTHDGGEGNPVDKFGGQFKAAVLTAMLLRPVLYYNGLEQGVGQRDNVIGDLDRSVDRDKALPFDIPVALNWEKSDAQNQAYLQLVTAKGEEYKELLDTGAMEVLGSRDGSSVVAFTVASKRPGTALIAAANFGTSSGSAVFALDKPLLKDFGAFRPKADKRYVLRDALNKDASGEPLVYERSGAELLAQGLFIGLAAGGVHLFEVTEL